VVAPSGAGLWRGTGPFRWIALGLVVVSLMFVLVTASSPDGLAWWLQVRMIRGHAMDGLITYHWHGRIYSVPAQYYWQKGPATVSFLPSDPSHADPHSDLTSVIIDWVTNVGPLALAALALAVGFARRHRARAYRETATFGHGLDPTVVARLLAERQDLRSGPCRLRPPRGSGDTGTGGGSP